MFVIQKSKKRKEKNMKTNGFMRILPVALVLALCMLGVCSAAVSVDDVTSVVGPQVNLTAKVTDMEATSYQWYICDDAEGTNPEAIEGATTATYTTPYLDKAGNTYYMVKVNDTESAVATVTATMPTEPVVLRFNNEKDLEYWSIGNKSLTTYNGKKVFSYPASADGMTWLQPASVYNDFYLQGYPYVVVAGYYPDHTSNTVDFYLGSDRVPDEEKSYGFSAGFTGMYTAGNGSFCKTIINIETRQYKTYCGDTVVNSGNASGDGFGGFDKWLGKPTTVRIDFSNRNAGKIAYAEYVGFFPTEEMALAYAGEMPHDDDMSSIVEALDTASENGDMDIPYESAATEATANAYMAQHITEVAADAVAAINAKGVETVEIEVVSPKYVPAENYWEDGKYTFTVRILVGDRVFRRSECEKTYTVALKAKAIGNVFVPDTTVAIGAPATLTTVLFNDTVATSYQWYTCKDTEGTDSAIIEGATSATYTTPNLNEFGSYYYKVVVNGTEEAVVAVSVGMPTEPVVLMFNNEYDLANWSANTDTKRLANIDGKTAFAYTAWSNDAHTSFKNLSQYNDFYLQGYPYFVISASYPDHETNTFDIYIGADGYDQEYRDTHYNFNFSVSGIRLAVNKGFCKTVVSAMDGSFKSYDAEGNVVASGKGSADGFKDYTTLIGKLATLRLDISNGNSGKDAYIEYFGFFPTEEMAIAYNGEMPEDDSANLLINALENAEANGELTMSFVNAENEEMVRTNAANAVEALTADTISDLKEEYNTVEFTVGDATYSRTSPYGRGVYEFEAKALVGDKPFRRSLVSTEVTMELKEKPDPVIMTFDTQEKVTAAGVGAFATEGTRKFLRVHKDESTNTSANLEVNYVKFHSQTGSTFNFQDYPYMKISYRRNAPAESKDALLVYAADNKPSFRIDTPYGTENGWEQMIVDMRNAGKSNSIAFYADGAATPSRYGTLGYINNARNWADTTIGTDTTPLEFRLSRYGYQERTHDYEYIAFFSSLDEAKMYPERLPENASYDVENLEKKNSFRAGEGVVTKAQAEAAADKYLENFVFATNHNIDKENAVFTPPSSKAEGTYVFDVWFGTERKEEFTVTVTMTLNSLPEPVIMLADSNTVFSTITSSNANLVLEDGVIKMTVKKPANDDGFFLLPKHPGSMKQFNVTTLPYLKMRYTISGINEDTSGNSVNPASVQFQLFTWFNTSFDAVPYKSCYPYAGVEDGDEVELIIDMSYVTNEMKNTDMIWVRNLTKGETEYRVVKLAAYRNEDNGDTTLAHRDENTKYTEVRLNLARTANLDRYAEFYYAGYFASLDEAKAFDSDEMAAEKLAAAETKLKSLEDADVEIPWSMVGMDKTEVPDSKATLKPDGSFDVTGIKTKTVSAMIGLKAWAVDYVGADGVVEITGYTAPTETEPGTITFNMNFESGYQEKSVQNVTASVSKKPSGYHVWRFNDSDILSKINYISSKNWAKIEDNLLKFDHKDAVDGSNYRITMEPSDFGQETFKIEDYSYMLMKYKRIGDISPCSFTFTNTSGKRDALGNVGWGWFSDNWYYTLYDTNIRDIVSVQAYNYNIDKQQLEALTYCKSYSAPTAAAFTGDVKEIMIDFGGRWYADRWMELEYIAFFPSMADARDYVQNVEEWEDLAADTEAELKKYTSGTVSYMDGDTQAKAEKKALDLIEDKVSAEGVTITVNTVSYTAPGYNTTDGSYVFTATVTKDGKTVYTTENITLTIGNATDNSPIVYRFTNPRFIKTIEGASDVYDFTGMELENDYFVLEVGADKPNVIMGVYNTLKLDAAFRGGFTAIINGNEEFVYEGDADGAVCIEIGNFAGNIDTLKIQFNNEGAKVRALGFFVDNPAAQAYDFDAVPEALTTAVNNFKGDHNYAHAHAKTLSNVKAHTKAVYLEQKINNSAVTVADVKYANYIPSTETEVGYTDVTATLGYGEETATYYKAVTFKVTLAKDAEVIKATPKSEGHEFLGWDTITATKNFAAAAQTVEFNIKVAQAQLTGTMNILKNGSANVALVDGKITVNGALAASTALKADTWTHVAITSDGKIYLDGTLDIAASSVSFSTNAPVIGDKFVGHLLDVRFWNDIRTAQEIAANKSTRTDSDGLLANWMLTADTYKWLEYFDSSANNNTAIFKSTGWYKMEAGLQGDYSFIHYGDTQSHFAIEPRSFKRIPDVFEWIGNNVEKYNIAHVSILGDATQTNTMFEWGVIREAHDFIEGKTTYHLPLGNHDYPSPSHGVGAEIRDTTNYRETFTYDDYVATYGPDGMNTFGGTFRDEKELTNMYNLVSVGGNDYIFFALEFSPRDAVLEWVGDVLTQYPDRQAIISTHCYFSTDGTLTTANATNNYEFKDGNEGIDIYNKLVTKYPNIIIADCGHSQGDDTKQHPHQRGSSYKDSPTADDFGNDVVQMLVDASAYAMNYPDGVTYGFGSSEANKVQFGADEGLIVIYMFEDNGRTMHTYVYSPLHDSFFRSVNEQTHTIKEIKTQPALNVVGTELREATTEQSLGMRFKMTLSKSFANFEDEVEVLNYGVVVVPEDVMEEGMEVTADMLEGTENAKYVKVEECSDTIFYEDDEKIDFTVVIHSIPTDDDGTAYARQFKARAYVDYTVNGGEVQRLYSFKTLTCSMNSLIND